MGRGLAPVARHLIFRDSPTPESAQQQECLQFAGTDSLKVVTSQDENCVLLIGSPISSAYAILSSEQISAMATRLGRFSFDPGPPDFLSLMRLMGWETRQSMRPKVVSRSPVPMNATSHGASFSASNSIASTNVSMPASTRTSRRLGSRDWTVVSLVSCRLLVPHVPVLYRGLSAFDWPPLSECRKRWTVFSSFTSFLPFRPSKRSSIRSILKGSRPAAAPRSTETCRAPASPPFVYCFRPSPKAGIRFSSSLFSPGMLLLSRSTITWSKGNAPSSAR